MPENTTEELTKQLEESKQVRLEESKQVRLEEHNESQRLHIQELQAELAPRRLS